MKRIIQLLFCATFVMGVNAVGESKGAEQQKPADTLPKGFRENIEIKWYESFLWSIYNKSLGKDMILSLEGEELIQEPTVSVKDKITQNVRFRGTNNFPCIPNISQLKEVRTLAVDGEAAGHKQAIYLPAGTQYQVAEISWQKVTVGVVCFLVMAGLYKMILERAPAGNNEPVGNGNNNVVQGGNTGSGSKIIEVPKTEEIKIENQN